MLPKKQSKGVDQGPPKYQPPPQVNSKQYPNNAPFPGAKEGGGQPTFSSEVKTNQADARKHPQVVKNGEMKRTSLIPQHLSSQGGELIQSSKEDAIRPLSPTRGVVRLADDNLIMRNANIRLPGEDIRPAWRSSTDEDLLQRPPQELLRVLRSAEAEVSRLSTEHAQLIRDARTRLQTSAAELRTAQEHTRRLQDDNQELRDLCCFLDDDRQKGRKLAREWQRFGRYTASVMRQEVSAYQGKLRELDNRQHELIRDNLELKELCLYLDEERVNHGSCASCGASMRPGPRDDGDGSSSSTNADEPPIPPPQPANPTNFIQRADSRERIMEDSILRQRNAFNDQLVGYIRSLEQRVAQLEEERRVLQQRLLQGPVLEPANNQRSNTTQITGDPASRPEAVVHALQVLQVREQLERALPPPVPPITPVCVPPPPILSNNAPALGDLATGQAELDDGEKALVREMCNVVWRKLEEAPPNARH